MDRETNQRSSNDHTASGIAETGHEKTGTHPLVPRVP